MLNWFSAWADRAVGQMRFFPDRRTVKQELMNHMEDRRQGYLESGSPEEEAVQKTLAAMGDAEETGKYLDRVHSPWLGWLWLASKVLCVLAVAWLSFLAVDAVDDAVRTWRRGGVEQHFCRYYAENPDMVYTPLSEVGLTRQIGDYSMTLDHGGWYRNQEDDGFFLILGWRITAKYPWQTAPLGLEAMKLETSDGTICESYPATYWPPEGPWIVTDFYMEESGLPVWTAHQTVDYAPADSGFLPAWFRFFLPDGSLEYTIKTEEGVWP